jgi:hypothetical protein
MNVGNLFDQVRATDETVAKALGISEVAQIARTETRLREYLLAEWQSQARRAVIDAAASTKKGANARQITTAVAETMKPWAGKVTPRMDRELAKVYRLAKIAGWKKATGQTKAPLTYDTPNFEQMAKAAPREGFAVLPTFDNLDTDTVDALANQQTFWLAAHYEENIGATIANTVSEVMAQEGRNRQVAAVTMRERLTEALGQVVTPAGWHGSVRQYMEGVAANAATVGRAYGQVSAFNEAGVTQYEIVNPTDERTCPVCSHVDGKVYTVEQANRQIGAELEAKNRDDIKSIHPWYSYKELIAISPKAGNVSLRDSAALAKAGFPLPPFHFRCRCAVDVH